MKLTLLLTEGKRRENAMFDYNESGLDCQIGEPVTPPLCGKSLRNNNQMSLITVILTDLDGVIRHWNSDPLHQKEVGNGLKRGYLFSISFEKELLSKINAAHR